MDALSLATNGIIAPIGNGKIIVTPKMPINVTILNPTTLEVSVIESNKIDVTVKD